MNGPTDKLVENVEKAQEILAEHESGDGEESAEEVVEELTGLLASKAMMKAIHEALGDDQGAALKQTLERLYASEINVDVASFFDSGWTVRIGDKENSFQAEKTFEGQDALGEIAPWLEAEATQLYPHYAIQRRTAMQAETKRGEVA